MHIGHGVALAFAFTQALRACDIELGLRKLRNQVRRQRGKHRIIARRLRLEEAAQFLMYQPGRWA